MPAIYPKIMLSEPYHFPLKRVWKVLFRPLNPPTLGDFHSVFPKLRGPGGLLKQF